MPLNTSGPLSIAGSTTGQSIALEFGQGATSTLGLAQLYRGGGIVPNISQNNNIPTLGTISIGNFYGATNQVIIPTRGVMFYGGFQFSNSVLRIKDAAQVQSETFVGTARSQFAGAMSQAIAIFYAGYAIPDVPFNVNTVTRVDNLGQQFGSETFVGSSKANHAAATLYTVPTYALFYGGILFINFAVSFYLNTRTMIFSNGAQVNSESSIGTGRFDFAGAGGSGPMFFGGRTNVNNTIPESLLSIFNSSGTALTQSETTVGRRRRKHAGAVIGGYGQMYGGDDGSTKLDTVIGYNFSGGIILNETAVGTRRSYFAGARDDDFNHATYYGGFGSTNPYSGNITNVLTRVRPDGSLVGSEVAIASTRWDHASSSYGG